MNESPEQETLLEATNRAYLALGADAAAWREFQRELEIWDDTIADGLEDATHLDSHHEKNSTHYTNGNRGTP